MLTLADLTEKEKREFRTKAQRVAYVQALNEDEERTRVAYAVHVAAQEPTRETLEALGEALRNLSVALAALRVRARARGRLKN